MYINFVEFEGFRGFRKFNRIEIKRGFAILLGRNGVGKTSICDAIEVALTGTLARYRDEKIGKETIADYLWWRDMPPAENHFVRVGFIDDAGKEVIVSRVKGQESHSTNADVALLANQDAPSGAVEQFARFAFIRDELIARQSFELSDEDRFRFVAGALGSLESATVIARTEALAKRCAVYHKEVEQQHAVARSNVQRLLEEVTLARDKAESVPNFQRAALTLQEVFNISESANQLELAEREITELGLRLSRSDQLAAELKRLLQDRIEFQSAAYQGVVGEARTCLSVLDEEISALEIEQNQLIALLRAGINSDIHSSLATLFQHAETLETTEGHCPLCDAQQDIAEFRAGMRRAQVRLNAAVKEAAIIHKAIASVQAQINEKKVKRDPFNKVITLSDSRFTSLRDREEAFLGNAASIGLAEVSVDDQAAFHQQLSDLRIRHAIGSQSIGVLRAGQLTSGISAIEDRLRDARASEDLAQQTLAKAIRASLTSTELHKATRRLANEVIDDKLSAISPLLTELYRRLRPHAKWLDMDYKARGELRKALTLSVGEALSPEFIFSSGQRRSAGLAFLLSVFLSVKWSNIYTIILDDPVQHIDDYRALHLAELLTAMRRDDVQVICAVEDEALAIFLSRRLRSSLESPGARYDISIDATGDPKIVGPILEHPLPLRVVSTTKAAS